MTSLESESGGLEAGNKDSLSPAVNSAADILDLLGEGDKPVGISDVSRHIGRARSTVANIVAALEQTGLIERHGTGYLLGRKLVELAGAYLSQTDLVADFHRVCRTLPVARDETLSLSSFSGGSEILYLAHHNGTQPVRWFANVGARLPVISTAMGVSLLSTLEDEEFERFLSGVTEYPRLTDSSYKNEAELREAVDHVRRHGYIIGDQLNTLGLCSISRPVESQFDPRAVAVGVTLLSARMTPELKAALLEDLDELANNVLPEGVH